MSLPEMRRRQRDAIAQQTIQIRCLTVLQPSAIQQR